MTSDSPTIRLMEGIADLAPVTGAEYRVFEWLLRDFLPGLEVAKKTEFNVEFSNGQLLVHWNGLPSSNKRLVLVAHVDRDGYVIVNHKRQQKRVMFEAIRPTHPLPFSPKKIDESCVGESVRLNFGSGEHDRLIGKIAQTDENLNGDDSPGKILIEMENSSPYSEEILGSFESKPFGFATAHHWFPHLSTNIRTTEDMRRVEAWGLDNLTGVCLVLSTIATTMKSGANNNISVLLSTGEKNGFTGVLSLIGGGQAFIRNQRNEERLWLVVDCSDQFSTEIMQLDEWRLQTFGSSLANLKTSGQSTVSPKRRCDGVVPCIRLEDLVSVFDFSVIQFLYATALSCREKLSNEKLLRGADTRTMYRRAGLGQSGRFLGGRCEATVLSQIDLLQKELGVEIAGVNRVGSIAIPLANYRHLNSQSGVLQPESIRKSAIEIAEVFLNEICATYKTHSFCMSSYQGYRASPKIDDLLGFVPNNKTEFIGLLAKRIEVASERTEANTAWIENHGYELIRDLCG